MNLSTTYIASGVAVLALVLPLFGLEIADEGTLTNTVQGLVGAVAVFYTFYGRWRAGGISAWGLRKK